MLIKIKLEITINWGFKTLIISSLQHILLHCISDEFNYNTITHNNRDQHIRCINSYPHEIYDHRDLN